MRLGGPGHSDYDDLFDGPVDEGADILQNSWGADVSLDYTDRSEAVDEWAHDNPDVPVIFANGNSDGPHSESNAQAIALNSISVGAVQTGHDGFNFFEPDAQVTPTSVNDINTVSDLNDHPEPATESTVPDVNAPGDEILAPSPDDPTGSYDPDYESKRGTSMAAPHVSGITARYIEAYPEATAAEIKAGLAASAHPVDNPNDYLEGHGGIDGTSLIYQTSAEHQHDRIRGTIEEGEVHDDFTADVPEDAEHLVVSIAWMDPPGDATTTDPLVNELTLSASHTDSPITYTDFAINDNVGVIEIDDPESGEWEISVEGASIEDDSFWPWADGEQDYAGHIRVIEEESELDVHTPDGTLVGIDETVQIPIALQGHGDAVAGIHGVVEDNNVDVDVECDDDERWNDAFVAGTLTGGHYEEIDLCVEVDDIHPGSIEIEVDATNHGTVTETITVLATPPMLSIAWVTGQAGSHENPEPVTAAVELDHHDGPVESDMFDIEVGDEPVDSDPAVIPGGPFLDEYILVFTPPEQSTPGEYDLDITFTTIQNGEEYDSSSIEEDAITYVDDDTTQIAASLQIDRSGSMRGIMQEAREGGVTFVEQATDEDYVSVVSYATSSRVDHDLARLGDERESVIDSIEGLSAGGFTNIGEAMEDGLDTLEDAPDGAVKAGIHMTDGILNRGPSEQEILDEIVPDYNERGVCLYTIGFTDAADEEFMKEVAEESDCGGYEFAAEEGEVEDAQETLQAVFADMQADVTDADTLELSSGTVDAGETITNSYTVDETVTQSTANIRVDDVDLSEMTADASTSTTETDETNSIQTTGVEPTATRNVSLYRPDGTEVDGSHEDVNISVVGQSVIYRIADPDAGEWSYEVRNDQDEATDYSSRITAHSRTSLFIDTIAERYSEDGAVALRATLVGPDGPVTDASVNGTIKVPDDETVTVPLTERDTGVYTGIVDVEVTGTYDATVRASTDTLSRIERTEWTVEESPPITISQADIPEVDTGTSTEFDVNIERTEADEEDVVVDVSDLSATDGDGTISSEAVDVFPQSFVLDDDGTAVEMTVSAPGDIPGGTYEGVVRVHSEDGPVVTEPIQVIVHAETCVDLVAGQHDEAGDVCLKYADDELEVTFETTDDWALEGTHLAVGEDLETYRDEDWVNPQDNPRPGHFPYSGDHDSEDVVTYTVPMGATDADAETLVVAAKADVTGDRGREGAWAEGERFTDRGNWAMYIVYDSGS